MTNTRADRRSLIQSRAQALAGPCAQTGLRAATATAAAEDDKPATKSAELWLYGVVGGYWWGFDSESVAAELRRMGEVDEITVRLDSPGGNAFQGISIQNLLANHPAKVTIVVDGLAASAASMIALGGEELVMSPGSQMMLHDAWMLTVGNAAELHSDADWLDKQSQNYAETYAHRAGQSAEHWRSVMLEDDGRGTWYTAAEAVEAGLADRVGNIATTTPPPPEPTDALDLDVDEMAARAAFDLDVLVHPSVRAAWTSRHPSAQTPKPPTAPADGNTHTEGGAMSFINDVRTKLGVSDESADEAAILAALDEVLDEQAENQPEAGAQVPEGMSLVSTEVLTELREGAKAGREAQTALRNADRDATIDAALRAGKITVAQARGKDGEPGHFTKLWDADPEGTRALLASLAPGLVPVSEHGHDNPTDEARTEDDAAYAAVFGEDEKKGA